jgi:hypothetical protein
VSVQRVVVSSTDWLGVRPGVGLIVLRASGDGKPLQPWLAEKLRIGAGSLVHVDNCNGNDFSDGASKWSKPIAASGEWNLKSELSLDEFDWAFK